VQGEHLAVAHGQRLDGDRGGTRAGRAAGRGAEVGAWLRAHHGAPVSPAMMVSMSYSSSASRVGTGSPSLSESTYRMPPKRAPDSSATSRCGCSLTVDSQNTAGTWR